MGDDIKKVFAANMRSRRLKAGLSQEVLADLAKVDRSYVSFLERGVYAASIDVVDKIAKVLEVEAAELLRRPVGRADAVKADPGS